MPRKCFGCKQEYLNGASPAWWRFEPRVYMIWELHQTYGRPNCKVTNVELVPLSTPTPYKRTIVSQLSEEHYKAMLDHFAHWFLLREDELDGPPTKVDVECRRRCEVKGM